MLRGLDEAAQNNFTTVVFYGGEPFIEPDLLFEGVEHAYERGLVPQITTNGFWGKDAAMARTMFERCHSIQKQHETSSPLVITLSTDLYHNNVPASSHATIITEHLRSPANVDLHLTIGFIDPDSPYIDERLNEILDRVDEKNRQEGIFATTKEDALSGSLAVRFVDKTITVQFSDDVETILRKLENEQMLPPEELELLRCAKCTTVKELFQLIHINNMLLLVQTPELREKGEGSLGRFMPSEKNLTLGFYPLSLIGRGRTLLENSSIRSRISEYRLSNPPPVHHHERSSLILGSDNNLYMSPIHLAHRKYPLGENRPDSMRRAIHSVNMREHTLGSILLQEDLLRARMFALTAEDRSTVDEIRQLEQEGLRQEALESLLLSQQAMQHIETHDRELKELLRH
jgi:hypothetical protein